MFLLIGWAINRWRTARKAEKNTIKLLKCISELKEKEARASSLTTELAAQCTILDQYLEALEQYRGVNFKGLPKEAQKDIVLMVDEAILLSDRVYILKGNPGRIVAEIEIEEEKPRSSDFQLSEKFLKYKRHILSML